MIKQSELEVMVCDLFVDAYRAGQSCGDLAYNAARGTRANLIDKIRDLYAELEHESYEREQNQVALLNANKENINLREQVRSYQATIRKLTHCIDFEDITDTDDEVPDHHDAFDAMFPGCTPEDLPFPDVEDLAPAEEVDGADE